MALENIKDSLKIRLSLYMDYLIYSTVAPSGRYK